MAIISKTYTFEASHHLPNHKGKCKRPHGHSYVLDVYYTGKINFRPSDSSMAGMVMDYDSIDEIVKPIVDKLDHYDLNAIIGLPPTAETIALWVLRHLEEWSDEHEKHEAIYSPWRVVLHETAKTSAEVKRIDLDRYENWRYQYPGTDPNTGEPDSVVRS